MHEPTRQKLTQAALNALENHYTGNCFGCERCGFYQPILDGDPEAVAAYVAFMLERHQETIETEPA